MSRKSVQRFCENDMHKNKDLKRVVRIRFSAKRFRQPAEAGCLFFQMLICFT